MNPPPSTRLAYIVLAVQIDERVSNAVAHDLALRSVDRCIEDINREFFCELESMTVLDDLNFERVAECKDAASMIDGQSRCLERREIHSPKAKGLSDGMVRCNEGSNPSALTNLTAGIEGMVDPKRFPGSSRWSEGMSDLNQQSFTLRHCNEQPKGDQVAKGNVDSCGAQYASGDPRTMDAAKSPTRVESKEHSCPLAELSPNESEVVNMRCKCINLDFPSNGCPVHGDDRHQKQQGCVCVINAHTISPNESPSRRPGERVGCDTASVEAHTSRQLLEDAA